MLAFWLLKINRQVRFVAAAGGSQAYSVLRG
jgi:hypothetical protein